VKHSHDGDVDIDINVNIPAEDLERLIEKVTDSVVTILWAVAITQVAKSFFIQRSQ
jgi:hypothetical protein